MRKFDVSVFAILIFNAGERFGLYLFWKLLANK